jgi:hypothetical protein
MPAAALAGRDCAKPGRALGDDASRSISPHREGARWRAGGGPVEFTAANANVRYKLPTGALSYSRSAANRQSNTKVLIHKPWLGRC